MSILRKLIDSEELGIDTKTLVLAACFGHKGHRQRTPGDCRQFLKYYTQEARRVAYGRKKGTYPIPNFDQMTHEDIFQVIQDLVQKRNQTRLRVLQDAGYKHPLSPWSSGHAYRIIDLTIRMWLMLDVRDVGFDACQPSREPHTLEWEDEESLDDLIFSAFPRSDTELSLKESRLEPSFTAHYMVDICGLHIRWSKSLHNHRLERRSKVLWIFPYTDFFLSHLKAGGQNTSSWVGLSSALFGVLTSPPTYVSF